MALLEFFDKKKNWQVETDTTEANWIEATLAKLNVANKKTVRLKEVADTYEQATGNSFESFTSSPLWQALRENGLLVL